MSLPKFSTQKSPTIVETLSSYTIQSVSAESLTFIKQDGTADAGEAAGTIVLAKLAKAPVLNLFGDRIGEYSGSALSTSISFTTGVMDSTLECGFIHGGMLNERITQTIAYLATKANGSWACDYLTGLIILKKKTTGTSQSISYKVRATISGGSSDITSVIPGTSATNLGKAEDAATASGDTGVAILERRIDTLASSAGTDGDYAFKNQDSLGASYSREVYAPTFEDNAVGVAKVEQRFSYSYISTATTTTIKSGAGFLHTITITEAVASTIIVYDNTAGSGTIIASFVASAGVGTYHLNVAFGTGLTIVTAGASKLTTSYR